MATDVYWVDQGADPPSHVAQPADLSGQPLPDKVSGDGLKVGQTVTVTVDPQRKIPGLLGTPWTGSGTFRAAGIIAGVEILFLVLAAYRGAADRLATKTTDSRSERGSPKTLRHDVFKDVEAVVVAGRTEWSASGDPIRPYWDSYWSIPFWRVTPPVAARCSSSSAWPATIILLRSSRLRYALRVTCSPLDIACVNAKRASVSSTRKALRYARAFRSRASGLRNAMAAPRPALISASTAAGTRADSEDSPVAPEIPASTADGSPRKVWTNHHRRRWKRDFSDCHSHSARRPSTSWPTVSSDGTS